MVILVLLLLVSGCATHSTSNSAICDRLAPLAEAHGRELVRPGVPDRVVETGEPVVLGLLAGCG